MPEKLDPDFMVEISKEMANEIFEKGYTLVKIGKGRFAKITFEDLYINEEDIQKLKKVIEEERRLEEEKKND